MKYKNLLRIAVAPILTVLTIGCAKTPDDGKVSYTFKNYDGAIITPAQRVDKGTTVRYEGNVPIKPKTGSELANIFIGWDKQFEALTEDTVYTAQYKTINQFIDKDHDGMPIEIDPNDDPNDPNSNYFEVGAKSIVYLDQNIRIDFSKFLNENANMHYDNEIAKLGLFLSNPKIDFKDGLFTDKAYGSRINALYARLGFDDYHHFDFKDYAADNYKYDPFDTTSGVYGHKYLFDSNGNIVKDLIVIAFEGTEGKNRWASNFDIGYDGDDYYKKVQRSDKTYEEGTKADHPEWDNKNFHKGFYVAAKRVLAETVIGNNDEVLAGPVKFLNYINEHSTMSNGKPIIFITGHSRGGAIANILGKYFETDWQSETNEEKCIPFTYAFAAPSIWGNGTTRPQTRTIFNVLNSDDIVTKVPYSEWGFTRFGDNEYVKSINDEYKDLYNQNVSKREYQRIDNIESILKNLNCENREEIYQLADSLSTKYMSQIALNTTSYTSEDDANKALSEMQSSYEKEFGDFFKFVKLNVVEREDFFGNVYYDIYASVCIGTIISLISHFMRDDQAVIKNIKDLVPLVSNLKFIKFLMSLGFSIFAGGADTVMLPHDYGAYHIILREYKATSK